jgi:hypothetical protein
MDDDSGRLVDDEQVLVLVRDPELPLLRLQACADLLSNLDLEHLPALQPMALRPWLAVHADGAAREQSLGIPARANLGQRGNEAVEPLSSSLWGN